MANPISARTRPDDMIRMDVSATAWMEKANCLGQDPAADSADEARAFARRYCSTCPVVQECLAYALDKKFVSVVAGNTFFNVHGEPNARWVAYPADERCA